jgi:hypothetical protein
LIQKNLKNVLLSPGELLQESPMRCRRFRLLFGAVVSALLVFAAVAPKADAVLVTYFNFEDTTLGQPITTVSSQPPGTQSSTLTITVSGLPPPTSTMGVPVNVAPGDMALNLHGAGFVTTTGGTATLSFSSVDTTGLTNLSLSFAINNNGNGFHTAEFFYSFTGTPGSFMSAGMVTLPPPPGGNQIVTFNYPSNVDNKPSVYFQVVFSGGTSSGQNLETIIDNIQLNAVPEPATTAGGVLGVLGLCWFQRRRLTLLLPRFGFRRLRRA